MNQSFGNYGLAIDEIRLVRTIKNLSDLMSNYEPSKRPKYILDEIAYLERELEFLKEERKH